MLHLQSTHIHPNIARKLSTFFLSRLFCMRLFSRQNHNAILHKFFPFKKSLIFEKQKRAIPWIRPINSIRSPILFILHFSRIPFFLAEPSEKLFHHRCTFFLQNPFNYLCLMVKPWFLQYI